MKTFLLLISSIAIVCVCCASGARAQQGGERPTPFDTVTEDPALPRVLLIGDSISIGYTLDTRSMLAGKANVQRIPENGGPTIRGLAKLDGWLGEKPWDVIHFNWGLHDLKYIRPGEQESLDIKGVQQVSPEDYRKNMTELVARLKKTQAKLIWAATTPVPEGSAGRVAGDELKYNAIALEVMQEAGIAVNDLHAYIAPKLDEYQQKANVHFTADGSKFLARKVAAEIEKALGK